MLRGAAAFAVVVAVGALVLASVSALRPIAPAPSGGGAVVDGYPERIGHQWIIHDLPDAPGPMAALLDTHVGDSAGSQTWLAVSATGGLWKVPVGTFEAAGPTLSPSGRQLAYEASPEGPYMIQDLVNGRRQSFAISSGMDITAAPHWSVSESPTFWSKDEQHLLFWGGAHDTTGNYVLIDRRTGAVRTLDFRGWPAGWVDSDHLAFIVRHPIAGAPHRPELSIEVVTELGQVMRPVPLGGRAQTLDQYSQVVSSDGRALALVDDPTSTVRTYALTDGHLVSTVAVPGVNSFCPATFAGDRPLVSVTTGEYTESPRVVEDGSPKPIVAIDPRLRGTCMVWAADALTGNRRGSIFGLSNTWISWWWREALLGLIVAALTCWRLWIGMRRIDRRMRVRDGLEVSRHGKL